MGVVGKAPRSVLRYLEQQLEAGDALKGQNQEGLEGKTLAHRVTFQLLQDFSEIAVAIPVWGMSLVKRNVGIFKPTEGPGKCDGMSTG